MHISLSSTVASLAALATLATPSSAFVMRIYDSGDCSGASRSVNVWDNTCATPGGFRSFTPTTYGTNHQRMYFFSPGNCGDIFNVLKEGWADGGGSLKIGTCYGFGNQVANAAASYYTA
ncbi:hypothetical protein IQ07DRAFT_593512 [Pyrenochaeta sp. DS3sAY3a]|nr:hypothetical protein IQ07DRAFT_593512 [Pyrenochaeta sp. DS3sAY3a]